MEDVRIVLSNFGGPEELEMVTVPVRDVFDKMVRIKVEASGVSFSDIMIREGKYPNTPTLPFTPGYELVGIVDKVGENVNLVKVGDRVGALTVTGGYATFAYIQENELIKIPHTIHPHQAAALFLNYVTAYQLLNRVFTLKNNQQILIHGAAGGVGSALVELAKLKNVTIFGTASKENHESLRDLGVIPIDYRSENFIEVIKRSTKNGVDVVFDPIGGDNWVKSSEVLNKNGILVGYGNSSAMHDKGRNLAEELANAFPHGQTENGRRFVLYSISRLKISHPEWYNEDMKELFSMLQKGKINPAIAKVFPLNEVCEAHQFMETHAKMGKVLLKP